MSAVPQNQNIMEAGAEDMDAGWPADSAGVCRSGGFRDGGYRRGGRRRDLLRGRRPARVDEVDDSAVTEGDDDEDSGARRG